MMKKGVVYWLVNVNIVTDSIARSAKRRYLSNPAGRIYRRADGIRAAVAAMFRHRHAASGPTEDRLKHLQYDYVIESC